MSVFIYDAVRTVRGKAKPDGGLAALSPEDLVAAVVDAIGDRMNADPKADALILGAVGQIGAQGGNIALVAKFRAGLADGTAAFCLNNYCTSGLTAIGQAAGMVSAGYCQTALAGGVEMMSRVPFMGDQADYYTKTTLPSRTRYLPVALAADRYLAFDFKGLLVHDPQLGLLGARDVEFAGIAHNGQVIGRRAQCHALARTSGQIYDRQLVVA